MHIIDDLVLSVENARLAAENLNREEAIRLETEKKEFEKAELARMLEIAEQLEKERLESERRAEENKVREQAAKVRIRNKQNKYSFHPIDIKYYEKTNKNQCFSIQFYYF